MLPHASASLAALVSDGMPVMYRNPRFYEEGCSPLIAVTVEIRVTVGYVFQPQIK